MSDTQLQSILASVEGEGGKGGRRGEDRAVERGIYKAARWMKNDCQTKKKFEGGR